jgi:hypothetical protein
MRQRSPGAQGLFALPIPNRCVRPDGNERRKWGPPVPKGVLSRRVSCTDELMRLKLQLVQLLKLRHVIVEGPKQPGRLDTVRTFLEGIRAWPKALGTTTKPLMAVLPPDRSPPILSSGAIPPSNTRPSGAAVFAIFQGEVLQADVRPNLDCLADRTRRSAPPSSFCHWSLVTVFQPPGALHTGEGRQNARSR